jgi:thymidylate synthase ThyX
MDNEKKLAIYGTQDEEKQSKDIARYVLDTTTYKHNVMYACKFIYSGGLPF